MRVKPDQSSPCCEGGERRFPPCNDRVRGYSPLQALSQRRPSSQAIEMSRNPADPVGVRRLDGGEQLDRRPGGVVAVPIRDTESDAGYQGIREPAIPR